ncbi:MAG: (d)CMP kinase [Candidatus Eremiobacteraeota bacterium]|uniref:(d)CMP kinase n=1 Tax=mine drainage metagenome TaxID=410659 RepID=E6PJ44_9ZZZZ|nr:(d)CMP kinase [Candidatus Eremiobacteraeota bacterium]
MTPPHLQIALDGPAGSGKTTVARRLAERLALLYLDTGAMYRALAVLSLRERVDADNEPALLRLLEARPIELRLEPTTAMGFIVLAGGEALSEGDLQANAASVVVSTIAAHPRIRERMVAKQREIARLGPVIMAGRDIGTVVLPDAQVKIFLTASIGARVARRSAQFAASGTAIDAHALYSELEERDRLDESRANSPLQISPDAHVIDSSELGIEEVVSKIATLAGRVA